MLAGNVRVIEPVKKVIEQEFNIPQRKRVCAYCRVSTDSDEQVTSYQSQLKYYSQKIQSNPEWQFVRIYADEGITGTSMRKRDEFRKMIDDCRAGKIDLILCKSVSRWARCTTDSLNVIEELTQLKIPVIFESENLNSMSDEKSTKLRLTIESASAEEYSQSLSSSVKWGRIRRIEQGHYQCPACYGYRNVGNIENMAIYEPEAEVVRRIFRLYIEGNSYNQICDILNNENIPAPLSSSWKQTQIKKIYNGEIKVDESLKDEIVRLKNEGYTFKQISEVFNKGKVEIVNTTIWKHSQIERMLVNEKYVGDLMLQKTTYTDIKFRKRIANTEGKRYYIDNHHPAIVTRATWDRVQKEREFRTNQRGYGANGRSVYTSKYAFSNRVYCLRCGSKFRRHYYDTQKDRVFTWVCINHKQKGNCEQLQVTEKSLQDAFVKAINGAISDQKSFIEDIIEPIKKVIKRRETVAEVNEIGGRMVEVQNELMNMINNPKFAGTVESQTVMQNLIAELDKLKRTKLDKERIVERNEHDLIKLDEVETFIKEHSLFEKFDDFCFKKICEKVLIEGRNATFVFCGDLRITINLDEI